MSQIHTTSAQANQDSDSSNVVLRSVFIPISLDSSLDQKASQMGVGREALVVRAIEEYLSHTPSAA